jgi:hypothetical protein
MYDRVEQYVLYQYRALRTHGDTPSKSLNVPAEQAVQAEEPAARTWCLHPPALPPYPALLGSPRNDQVFLLEQLNQHPQLEERSNVVMSHRTPALSLCVELGYMKLTRM